MSEFTKYNRRPVAQAVDALLQSGRSSFGMWEVYDDLSIFDWFTDTLSKSRLRQMASFLRVAHKFGYDGYVCFKVGCSGTANGMWAYKAESTTGYSPDGEYLYHSFTPEYNEYAVCLKDGCVCHNSQPIRTIKDLKAAIVDIQKG